MSAPRTLVVIPARMASTRLPGKPLADIAGQPMIVRVWRAAAQADLGEVIVATDSGEVADAIAAAGGRAIMTSADHPSGSDRVHEAVILADPDGHYDAVLNLQGDLPTIEPAALRLALEPLADPAIHLATLVAPVASEAEADAPSVVKMVGSALRPGRYRALYFTRARAPHGAGPLLHHVGLYAWRRSALARFVALPPSPLERRESLEQLRALEDGMRIDAMEIAEAPLGVDTPADLAAVRARFGA